MQSDHRQHIATIIFQTCAIIVVVVNITSKEIAQRKLQSVGFERPRVLITLVCVIDLPLSSRVYLSCVGILMSVYAFVNFDGIINPQDFEQIF